MIGSKVVRRIAYRSLEVKSGKKFPKRHERTFLLGKGLSVIVVDELQVDGAIHGFYVHGNLVATLSEK